MVQALRDPVTLAWMAPLYPGASPITGYRVEAKLAADPQTAYRVIAANISASPYVPAGLQKGDYAFRVAALNAQGVSDPSYDAYGTVGDPVLGTAATATGATPA